MTRWLQITSGRGPAECCRVVAQVLQRMIEEAGEADLTLRVLEAIPGDQPRTFRSVLLAMDREDAGTSQFAAQWVGTVQWIGTSPFRPHHRRRNWYVGVEAIAVPGNKKGAVPQCRALIFDNVGKPNPSFKPVVAQGSRLRRSRTAFQVSQRLKPKP